MSVVQQDENPREEELEGQQGKLYPVGRALRRTFDAENHDSLGTDLTGLMLQLTRIDADAAPGRGTLSSEVVAPSEPQLPSDSPAARARGWWRGAMKRLLK